MTMHRDLAETVAMERFNQYVAAGCRVDPFYPGDKALIERLVHREMERQRTGGIHTTEGAVVDNVNLKGPGYQTFKGIATTLMLIGAYTVIKGIVDLVNLIVTWWLR